MFHTGPGWAYAAAMAEVRVNPQKTEGGKDGDSTKYGYTVIRAGVPDAPSPFRYKTAEEAEEAGLKAAAKAEKDAS